MAVRRKRLTTLRLGGMLWRRDFVLCTGNTDPLTVRDSWYIQVAEYALVARRSKDPHTKGWWECVLWRLNKAGYIRELERTFYGTTMLNAFHSASVINTIFRRRMWEAGYLYYFDGKCWIKESENDPR